MTEQELIERLLKNDSVVFKRLVDEQKGSAFNISLSILQNSEDAEDITQEVFIEVFESLKNLKETQTCPPGFIASPSPNPLRRLEEGSPEWISIDSRYMALLKMEKR